MEMPSTDVCTAMKDTLKAKEENTFAASMFADAHADACTASVDP
jgi:hypothetical protein